LALLVVQLFLGRRGLHNAHSFANDPQPLNPMFAVTVAHVACGAWYRDQIVFDMEYSKCCDRRNSANFQRQRNEGGVK